MWCWRLGCAACLPRCAYVRAIAIADAAPERFCTFTAVGDSWQTVRSRMRHLAHEVRARGVAWEWVWSVEPNPKGTGHHVHCWQRGGYVSQRVLSAAADACGMGRVVDVRAWRAQDAEGAGYGLKGITYGVKGAGAGDGATAWLAANGGRLTHQSRAWWGPAGVRAAERSALERRRGPQHGRWELVSVESMRWDARVREIAEHRPVVRRNR